MIKPYIEYKSINLPWLKSIPSHWSIQRAKNIFFTINERSENGQEELLSVSSNYGIIKRKNANVTMFKAESYVDYKLCWDGDLVINSLWAWQTGLGFSPCHGIISTAYSVFRLKDEQNNQKYLHYYLRGTDFHWELRVRSKGIWKSRYQLSDESFFDSPIILPPRPEQNQIVRFLDWKMAMINAYIKIKKKQVELLQEQKQAIINQAVTKGLNPNVAMKDSGIDWLGKIPAHWHLRPFSKIATICSNLVHPQNNLNLPQVSPASIEKNTGRLLTCQTVYETGIISDNHRFHKGQILYSKIRPKLNKVTIAPFDGLCSADMYPIETKLVTKYLMFFMLSHTFLSQLSATENRVKMPKINQEELSIITVLFPDEREQNQIVAFVEAKLVMIDKLLSSIADEISLLQEYRTRLISDVVTGKVDVRGVKVPKGWDREIESVDNDNIMEDDKN